MKLQEILNLLNSKIEELNLKLEDDINLDLIFGEKKFDIRKFYKKINVLDHGFIELIDGPAEDPKLKIVNAARVSFAKESFELSEKDIKLVNFLFRQEHLSTFRHSHFTWRIKLPLCVARQFFKYQVGSDWIENELANSFHIQLPGKETAWSEESGRYVEFEPEFYIPQEIRIQSKDNKQGSHGKLDSLINGEDPVEFFRKGCVESYERYKYLVASGAAKEQSRMILSQNIYTTAIWTTSLQASLWFLHQRLPSDAQWEARRYALAKKEILEPILYPLSILDEVSK